jgi:methionine-rich copper-binding protein CopC
MHRIPCTILVLALGLLGVGNAGAHAFPDHSDPRVGATLHAPPVRVRVWFDSALEPAFSTITVHDAAGKMVDKRDGRVNRSDATLLEVSVPRLPPGTYRVIWSVVARDGHRTTGDYTFVIK